MSFYFAWLSSPNGQHLLTIKSSGADCSIKVWKFSNVSGTELVPETLENFHVLKRLSAQEDFIEVCHHESYKTYFLTRNTLRPFFYSSKSTFKTKTHITLTIYSWLSLTLSALITAWSFLGFLSLPNKGSSTAKIYEIK